MPHVHSDPLLVKGLATEHAFMLELFCTAIPCLINKHTGVQADCPPTGDSPFVHANHC